MIATTRPVSRRTLVLSMLSFAVAGPLVRRMGPALAEAESPTVSLVGPAAIFGFGVGGVLIAGRSPTGRFDVWAGSPVDLIRQKGFGVVTGRLAALTAGTMFADSTILFGIDADGSTSVLSSASLETWQSSSLSGTFPGFRATTAWTADGSVMVAGPVCLDGAQRGWALLQSRDGVEFSSIEVPSFTASDCGVAGCAIGKGSAIFVRAGQTLQQLTYAEGAWDNPVGIALDAQPMVAVAPAGASLALFANSPSLGSVVFSQQGTEFIPVQLGDVGVVRGAVVVGSSVVILHEGGGVEVSI